MNVAGGNQPSLLEVLWCRHCAKKDGVEVVEKEALMLTILQCNMRHIIVCVRCTING